MNPSPLAKLSLTLIILALMPTLSQERVTQMDSAISNPSMLSICQKRQAFVVAGNNRIEIFKSLQGKFTQESLNIDEPIVRIKCLKQGFIAVATEDKFYIIDPSAVSIKKSWSFKGKPHSIAEQPENNMTYLLISVNSLELKEIQATNYGSSFNKTSLSLALQRNIATATYVANRQYIYISDELSQITLYRNPFTNTSRTTIDAKDLSQIRQVKGLGNTNSALLTDLNGNFVLIKEQEQVGSWTGTPYERGCLCTKEKFVLANSKKLAIYDFEEVKLYDGFTVNDLADIACVSDGKTHTIYLLDGSGKIVVVNIESNEGSSFFIYLVIILAIVIVALVAKFMWYTPKQATSTDYDDASKQDRENNYKQLRDFNAKDYVKETK